jgi:hypothetical protein
MSAKKKGSAHYYPTPKIDKLAVNSGNLVKLLNVFARIDGQLVILGRDLCRAGLSVQERAAARRVS